MSEQYLALYLDAPMQSWGHASRFNRRTTGSWPTKSGVVGILCAAMGIDKKDQQGIEELSELGMKVLVLHNAEQRLMDYHTVGGARDRKNPREKRFISPTANGGLRQENAQTVPTHREYLLDAKFGVILWGNGEIISKCKDALQNPKWGIWFGRKCCLPASRIYEGAYRTRKEASQHLKSFAKTTTIRTVAEVESFEDGTDSIMDIPVNFASRKFMTRRIKDSLED